LNTKAIVTLIAAETARFSLFSPVRGAGPRLIRPSTKRWRGSFPFLFPS